MKINILYSVIVFALSLIMLSVPAALKKIRARQDNETREFNTLYSSYETDITLEPHSVKMFGLRQAFISRLDKAFKKYYEKTAVKAIGCEVVSDHLSVFFFKFAL
ncbi:MAG: hypothetical protein LUE12_07095 [Ruminococcus sp.]|nr:hypothetical protein [Ruminococcus sp.]